MSRSVTLLQALREENSVLREQQLLLREQLQQSTAHNTARSPTTASSRSSPTHDAKSSGSFTSEVEMLNMCCAAVESGNRQACEQAEQRLHRELTRYYAKQNWLRNILAEIKWEAMEVKTRCTQVQRELEDERCGLVGSSSSSPTSPPKSTN